MLKTNEVYLGDCLEVMKGIEDGSVDMILCDLPYGISRKSGFASGKMKKYTCISQDFGDWDNKDLDLSELSKEYFRILKRGGVVVLFYDIWDSKMMKDAFAKFKQPRILQWVKTNPVPINSKINLLSNASEYAFSFVKGSKPTYNSKYNNGIFSYPICHGKERTEHTTQKPSKLFREIVKIYSNEGDVILDPFIGSGTTAIAAINTNRQFIGIEKDEAYYNIAQERIATNSVN